MSVYAGLDTSLDAVAICVIAETGEMLCRLHFSDGGTI